MKPYKANDPGNRVKLATEPIPDVSGAERGLRAVGTDEKRIENELREMLINFMRTSKDIR